ncbi:hypothetical protein FB446DRAFT_655507 [Lentinula raphanica]|nr:hypothetical protein FB446DRAFT_655507 [Lentinula raphanica]
MCKPQILNDEVEARLQQAKEDLLKNTDPNYTPHDASHKFDVPYKTLLNRIKGIQPRKKAHESEMLLTEAEEEVVIEWIHYLGLAGVPICKRTL